MKIRGWGRLKEYAWSIQSRLGAKAIVLCYHRVIEGLADPQRLTVSPSNFAQQLEVIVRTTCPVPLEEIFAQLKNRSRRDIPLSAVTFDDGYADNFEKAAPILARYTVPATVFIVTGTVNHPYELWWDALERIILRPDLPDSLELRIDNKLCKWSFRDEPDNYKYRDTFRIPSRSSRKAYFELAERLRSLSPDEREEILSQLFDWSGLNRQPRPGYKTMTEEDLRQLTAGGLITVGSHTVNHPVLSSLEPRAQAFEIQESQARLEQILGHPVRTFSYPYGRMGDYSRRTVRLVREAGFTCACANFPRVTSRWTDPMQLPRFGVGNWNGELFEKYMRKFLRTYS